MLDSLSQRKFDNDEFTLQDRTMLDYSTKLTLTPGEVAAGDVAMLRESGFDDRAIHDIACIVGYFAFVNRVADGLGVELEDMDPKT